MAESKERLEDVAKAFELLREKDRYALGLIKRWIERICFANFPKARVHYCDGTLLLKSENELPVSVLAAFLYRLAVEVMLVKRFGRLETLLTWRPDILIGLRKELRLLRKLSAPQS